MSPTDQPIPGPSDEPPPGPTDPDDEPNDELDEPDDDELSDEPATPDDDEDPDEPDADPDEARAEPPTLPSGIPKVATPLRPRRVAAVIPAKDESRLIAATVRAARAIPNVDLVLVVDDGSQDATQHIAREAGAAVVRHVHNQGKAAAMETGAAVVAMRDTPDGAPRALLFLDADLGESAVNTAALIRPVLDGIAHVAIANIPPQPGAAGHGFVVRAARRAITSLTGWTPVQPLNGMRCLTREAYEAATPLARGWGVEVAMTIDLLKAGYKVVEVPCDLKHRPSGSDLRGQLHRAAQWRDVQLAVNARRFRYGPRRVRKTLG